MQNNAIDRRKVQDGLVFILNHFQEPQFPRKIMTKQLGYQLEVFNKEEALEYLKVRTMKIVESTLILHLQNITVLTEHR